MANPEAPPLPERVGDRIGWSGLVDGAASLAIARAAQHHDGLMLAVAANPAAAYRLCRELEFFSSGSLDVVTLPDWETLAYDAFSPHQDIVSDRLRTLHRLPTLRRGVLVVPIRTLLQRLPPPSFLAAHSLVLSVGARFDAHGYRRHLEQAGYRCVDTVSERGEFAVRGSLVDVFPMGAPCPVSDRSVRRRSGEPAHVRYRHSANHRADRIGRDSAGQGVSADAGCDRSVPQSLARTVRRRRASLSDLSGRQSGHGAVRHRVLPADVPRRARHGVRLSARPTVSRCCRMQLDGAVTSFQIDLRTRYESLRHDIERPILAAGCDLPAHGRTVPCARHDCGRSCSTDAITASSSPRASCPTFRSIIARISPAIDWQHS